MSRPIDDIAETYVADSIAQHPTLATALGIPGYDDQWDDFSPDGFAAVADRDRRALAALHAATPSDERENTAKEAMIERLGLQTEMYEAHITTSRVSVIADAAHEVRETFDLMPTDSPEAWRNIAARLRTAGTPLAQTRQTLSAEAAQGNVSALRQINGAAEQIRSWTGETGSHDFFDELVSSMPAEYGDTLAGELQEAAGTARRAFTDFARWLETDLAPKAPTLDAVGEERYALNSRYFLGATVDLHETYEWGWAELERLQDQQKQIARDLYGHSDIKAAYEALDADPSRKINGAEAFRDWMQGLADQALADLADTHFDIPEPIRRIECCLAPTHDGGIYYTGPTEDFSRPGRMWWAVPEGIDDFSTWKEVTTVYHEGVPGHHLQVAQNAYAKDQLNRWQRLLCWVSGHGEGWALYAERLMDDLGYLSDPGNRMGMLDAQAFRAIRVIIDIGMHLQLKIPDLNPWGFRPAERWTPQAGLEFLLQNLATDEPTLRFELDRYLGWPGQAPSYKVGERIWLQARDEARRRSGADFDLRKFHADALNLGPMGLDPLRSALSRI
ncbi:hypothetical protein GCM10011575_41200 [Microlunatus endophyticus]|uniref:DUF885 domain-containing protein n=1 Tax=Microlunatus endophyticus TaxID=1716077 RepID=A0A917SH63_9ACTN|nr:DUF885 domain-containing protein [Microlunatus endophyticus]GGL78605.1 hypothetical protein GCM10011575_41200 [Microlunatus endophyticus]